MDYSKASKKHRNLHKALKRVQDRLESFKAFAEENLHHPYDKLTDEEKTAVRAKIDTFNWNDWHDLNDRIEERIIDNKLEWTSFCFEKYGFAAYDI